jgi:hypothetical protein
MPTLTKEKINYFEAIQLISLSNLYNLRNEKPTDRDYDLNRVFRYYSKTFFTPLYQVLQLPFHHVLTAYFDDLFEGMEQGELDEARIELLKSAEERAKDKDTADANEVDIYQIMQDTAKEAEAAAGKIEALAKSGIKPLIKNSGEAPLLVENLKPADIKMKFMTVEQLEKELNQDSLGLLEDP